MDDIDIHDWWDPQPGWLNTASYGLPPRAAWDALQQALADWRGGRTSWEGWDEAVGRSRECFARIVGVQARDVAVGASASQLIAPIAASLPAGARVLVPDIEFTSNVFPWLARGDLRVRVAEPAKLADSIQAGTDLVAFSLVQSADGGVARYEQIVAAARAHGALVVVDATQGCGWLPFQAGLADAVVVAAYKWLMAPRGTALAYLRPELCDSMVPQAANWYAGERVHDSYYGLPLRLADSARRFDISPAWFNWVGTAPTLEVIERIGVPAIHAHNVALANSFLAGLGRPPGDSAIVTVNVPDAQARLERAGVRAAVRNGQVRASFHIYSTPADVHLALSALVDD